MLNIREQINKLGVDVSAPCWMLRTNGIWHKRSHLAIHSRQIHLLGLGEPGYHTGAITRATLDSGMMLAFMLHHAELLALSDTQRAFLEISWVERKPRTYDLWATYIVNTFTRTQMSLFVREYYALYRRLLAGLGGKNNFYLLTRSFDEFTFFIRAEPSQVRDVIERELPYASYTIEYLDALYFDSLDGHRYNIDYSRDGLEPQVGREDHSPLTRDVRQQGFTSIYRKRKLQLLLS